MDSLLAVAVWVIPLAPLAAGVVSLAFARDGGGRSRLGLVAAAGCGCSCVASLIAVWQLWQRDPGESRSWELFRWIEISGPFPIVVSFGAQIDELSAVLISATTLASLVAVMHALTTAQQDQAAQRNLLAAPFLVSGATLLLLSPNVLQLLFFWQLTALGVFAAGADQAEHPPAAVAARKAYLIGRVGDVPLVFGLLLLWYQFHSANWIDVLQQQLAEGPKPEALHTLSAVGLCLLWGVVARSAQFPLLGWIEDVAATSAPGILMWTVVVLMPAGVYVIARFGGIMAAAEPLQLTAAILGGLTAFLAALSAACAVDSQRAIAYASVSLVGWTLLGFGSGEPAGMVGAIRLLMLYLLGMGVLVCAANRWLRAACALLLTSGCWGQSAILTALWDAAGSATGSTELLLPLGGGREKLLLLLLCLDTFALFLLSLGLFRAVFAWESMRAPHGASPAPAGQDRTFWLFLGLVVAGGLVLWPVWMRGPALIERVSARVWPELGEVAGTDLFSLGFGLLPALLGIVCAWMRFGPGSRPVAAAGPTLRSVVHWSRNRYFLDDAFFLFLVLPVRGLAQLCRFFDWFLIDGLLVQVPARVPSKVARLAEPLQHGTAQFYAVAVLLATSVLLAAVLWLRG